MFAEDLYKNAGRLIDRHTMVWTRVLKVPLPQVWEAVSTKYGLDQWWLCPVQIDLRPGGSFSHHWENTIVDLMEQKYINFGPYPMNNGGMRFEMNSDNEWTIFSFIDNWRNDAVVNPGESQLPEEANAIDAIQPGGPGTPWSGVAAGWHGTVDSLETYLTGKTYDHSWEEGCRFYAALLTDHFRWLKLVSSIR